MILQKCVTFWDYKREREKMKITKEDVLKIEHDDNRRKYAVGEIR